VARSYVDGLMSPDTTHTSPVRATPTVVGTSKGDSQAFKGRWYVQLSWHARSVNMEWTNDATLELISEYEKQVVLWDTYHDF
jgi:hypothetical protein